jgi:type I restriction enzyme S subunit
MGRSYAGVSVKEYHIVETGDIVYTKSPLKANPYGIIKENKGKPGIVSTLYAVYKTTAEGHPAYFDHYFSRDYNLNSYLQPIVRKGAKNDMKVNNYAVLGGEIFVPKLEEQQKIADCLDSLDGVIAAEGRKLEALRDHKRGLMQQLFPQPGQTQPRLRFPEFRDKREWSEHALVDIATFRRGSFPQPYGLPEWYDEQDGMPFIQVFDVSDNFRLKEKTKSKISKLGAEKSVFIPKGTLIVTLQGSIGRVAITHYDAYIDRTLLIFETFLKPIDKAFFARLIQNLFDLEKEKAPGGIIKTITKEALSDFKVKLPAIS